MKLTALVVAGALAATTGAAMAQDYAKSAPQVAKKLEKMSDAKLAKTTAGRGGGIRFEIRTGAVPLKTRHSGEGR